MNYPLKAQAEALAALVQRLPKPINAVMVLAAIGYVIWPLDCIPDFIPVFGQMDDAAVLFFAWQNLKAMFRLADTPYR